MDTNVFIKKKNNTDKKYEILNFSFVIKSHLKTKMQSKRIQRNPQLEEPNMTWKNMSPHSCGCILKENHSYLK